MANYLIPLLVALFAVSSHGRIMGILEIKDTMRAYNVPEDKLDTWMCVIEHESSFDTTAHNANTGDHGLFQISEIYWCSPPGTGCGVSCDSLKDDDIHNDIACALQIFDEHDRLTGNGFNAWVAYKYCH